VNRLADAVLVFPLARVGCRRCGAFSRFGERIAFRPQQEASLRVPDEAQEQRRDYDGNYAGDDIGHQVELSGA
jgi:hypothetical protein